MTNATPCARCNTLTDANALSMSLDGQGMICQACSITAKGVQEKAGTRKAYITGAIMMLIAALVAVWYVAIHIRN